MYIRYVRSLAAVGGIFHGLVSESKTVCTVQADQVDSVHRLSMAVCSNLFSVKPLTIKI